MTIPTWKVTIYARMYRDPRVAPRTDVKIVEAHTGVAAEEAALADRPNWKVLRVERLTGYDGRPVVTFPRGSLAAHLHRDRS